MMRIIIFSILLASCSGLKYTKSRPNSVHPGALSTITGRPFNLDNNLWIMKYEGYQDSKVYKYNLQEPECDNNKISNEYSGFPIPNMIQFDESKYVDQTEVTNLNWIEFLYFIKKDSTESQHQTLEPNRDAQPTSDYFSNPFFRYYPVVGITSDQVNIFNQWRTEVVKSYVGKLKKTHNFTVECRLPTNEEYIKYASCGQNLEPFGMEPKGQIFIREEAIDYLDVKNNHEFDQDEALELIKNHNQSRTTVPIFNVKTEHRILNDVTPNYVYELPVNCCDLYGIIGNVSEMIFSSQNEVKGGSYLDLLGKSKIEHVTSVELPTKDVGFRSVCVITPNEE